MNIKQIIPQIATSNDSSTAVEACCSTTGITKQNLSINTSIDIPKIDIGLTNSNPFRFLFSKGSSLYMLNHGLVYLMAFRLFTVNDAI